MFASTTVVGLVKTDLANHLTVLAIAKIET